MYQLIPWSLDFFLMTGWKEFTSDTDTFSMELVGTLATATDSSLICLFFFRLKRFFLLTVENSPWLETKETFSDFELKLNSAILSVLVLADLLRTSGAAVRVSKWHSDSLTSSSDVSMTITLPSASLGLVTSQKPWLAWWLFDCWLLLVWNDDVNWNQRTTNLDPLHNFSQSFGPTEYESLLLPFDP